MAFIQFLRDNAPFLAAGAILTFCSSFGQTFFISVFAGEIRAAYGLSHGQWGGIYTLSTMTSAVVMIWAGTLTDLFRVRSLGPIALGLLALACISMALAPGVVVLALAIFLLRFLGQGMMSHIAFVAMGRWFVATRGRATALAAMGFSFGEAVLPISFVALMSLVDWRWLWVLAALFPLVLVPVILRLLRLERAPQSIATDTPVPGMQGRYWTRREVLAHPLFWAMFPALFGTSAFNTAFLFHQVHLAEIKGWAHVELVALFPLYTATAVISSFAIGALIDRFGAPRLLPFYQLPLIGFFLLTPGIPTPLLMVFPLLLLGVTQGSSNPLINGFSAEFYGTRFIGSIKAAIAAVMVLGSAVGPGLSGWLVDLGVDFVAQMPWIAAFHVAASLSVWLGIRHARRDLPAAA